MIKVPKCMSTQHPDNITSPFFSDSEILAGESEVKEAFFVFSQLNCKEQMWDSEGKEVDNQVVEKLLSRYQDFFTKHPLGKEFFLTYRIPNPAVEKEQGKILLETLHGIPRAFDAAKAACIDNPPVFEVIIPMATSHTQLEMVKNYYTDVVIGQQEVALGPDKISVKNWVGDFSPENINVIPLFEDYKSLASCGDIVKRFIERNKIEEYQRVFLARSDPALNYGSASAVLLSKIALKKLHAVEEETGISIFPILGAGSAPFRGNLTPMNVNNCGEEYPSLQTFTIQSSFKYDYHFRDVSNAVDMINHRHRRPPLDIDEETALSFVDKMGAEYAKQIASIADLVNEVSAYMPRRRARKLHIGLFGYSRCLKGVSLPRAIKFCAAFYSLGIPPELLGLSALNGKEFDRLRELYLKFDEDMQNSLRFLNAKNLDLMPTPVKEGVHKVSEMFEYEADDEYSDITSRIFANLRAGNKSSVSEDIKSAAWKRKFLG